ncbi:MAG: glucosaminidase domain-containing protein [Acholeplasmataceae bacterium]|nr:glucosaminidase domain-containing protein [Acholeplasmataceae bacterium]
MKKFWNAIIVVSIVIFFTGTVQASEQKITSKVEQVSPIAANEKDKQQVPNQVVQGNDSGTPGLSCKTGNSQDKTINAPQGKNIEIKIMKPERKLPANYKTITITGESKVTESQAVAFLKKNNRDMKLKLSPEEIVRYYYAESTREGIRADLALCQALLETGFFKFGGTVKPNQNNFCGLGTISKSVAGASFRTPEIGVRAHIQHLLAYSTEREPKTGIVDPRYDLVHKMRKTSGYLTTWHSLNGNWAMSNEYSEKIFDLHSKMLAMPIE